MKVKDQNGNIVSGVFRTAQGGLIVNDQSAYDKYIKESEQAKRVLNMETQIADLQCLVAELLTKLNREER